ncbi:MAG: type I CRISPR-associated protein Cas7 [Nitrospira sp.]|nr:type I CRISPR-associated protein Cas7 [Nitrospira sp.]
MNDEIRRATGLLVIEVINSNPNGDPDRESDPRQRPDGRGEISPVSFKRKLRDLVEDKDGQVWQTLNKELSLINGQDDKNNLQFNILESRGRDRKKIEGELKNGAFTKNYWDGRIFGNTFLEEAMDKGTIKTGVVQFGLGLSVAPIEIERHTNTNKAGVQEGKNQGMAPMGYRFVPHGVYWMPFFVNPSMAHKSGCTPQDIELFKKLIPYAYAHTRSHARPFVELRHAWYCEHTNPLGSCSDFALIDALKPKIKNDRDPNKPSKSWDDYDAPPKLPENLAKKVACMDLIEG